MYFCNHTSLAWLGFLFSIFANSFVLVSNQASISLSSGCHNHIAFRVQPATEPLLVGSQEGNLKVQPNNRTIVGCFLDRPELTCIMQQQTPWSLALSATGCEATCSLTQSDLWGNREAGFSIQRVVASWVLSLLRIYWLDLLRISLINNILT